MTLDKIGEGLTRPERETIIRTSDGDDGWEIYTPSPVMARKLAKLCKSLGIELQPEGHWGVRASLPKGAVKLTKRSVISDAERERRTARLAAAREARKAAAVGSVADT
jgi:hypothetical protein